MVEAQRITDPNLLSDITVRLANLSVETSKPSHSGSQTQQAVKLVLLQPLANADMLAACRNPASRVFRREDGSICGPSNIEILNIQPLSAAWRQAVMRVAPISQVTFDLALPKEDESSALSKGDESTSAFQKVYWDTAIPREGGLAVRTQDVSNLATAIATGMRMRTNGDLRFGVTYDETEGVLQKAMARLEENLLVLAEYEAPRKDGDRGDQDGVE